MQAASHVYVLIFRCCLFAVPFLRFPFCGALFAFSMLPAWHHWVTLAPEREERMMDY